MIKLVIICICSKFIINIPFIYICLQFLITLIKYFCILQYTIRYNTQYKKIIIKKLIYDRSLVLTIMPIKSKDNRQSMFGTMLTKSKDNR